MLVKSVQHFSAKQNALNKHTIILCWKFSINDWALIYVNEEKLSNIFRRNFQLRILDFSHIVISGTFSPAERFLDAKKWSSALVFLSQLSGQPKDRFLYLLIMSWSEKISCSPNFRQNSLN